MAVEKVTVKIPEIGEYVRMYGTLVDVQDVTPKAIILDYVFEKTEARIQARVNGKKLRDYDTFNDFYGKETCVEHAIREAKDKQAWFGESDVEFVVIKITRQVRMRPDGHDRENFYAQGYRAMKDLDCGSRWDLPDEKEEVVWSSLTSPK